jgi:predicted nucleic acid-binding protein
VTDVVLAETAHLLTSVYGLSRAAVVDALIALVQKENVSVRGVDTAIVVQALLLCRPSRRVSFTDALVWAAARSSRQACVCAFDDDCPS